MRLIIKGCLLPEGGRADIHIRDGVIAKIRKSLYHPARADTGHPFDSARADAGHPFDSARADADRSFDPAGMDTGHPFDSARADTGHSFDPAGADRGGIPITPDTRLEDGAGAGGDPRVLDAGGLYALPALIDMHVHLRDPGFLHKETVMTGIAAAKNGGFGTVLCMPNTNPPIDNRETVDYILNRADTGDGVDLLPCGCITKGQRGTQLCDFSMLKQAGVAALSDDGKPVMTAQLMRDALCAAKKIGLPIISHCEETSLSAGGVLNDGSVAKRLGVKGIPNSAEDIGTARDVLLAGETGARLHIAHVSTKMSVAIIRAAKRLGIPVSAETCPHYFTLTEEAVLKQGANAKMNPPLRGEQDRLAVIEALCDGTIDCISTDHAPHTEREKAKGLSLAPMGIAGLETSFALSYTALVKGGYLSFSRLVELMYTNPARVLNVPAAGLLPGQRAKLILVQTDTPFLIDRRSFLSMGKNTPFDGVKVYGNILARFF